MSDICLRIDIDRPVKFEKIVKGQYFTRLNGSELFQRLDREGMSSCVETGETFKFDYQEEFIIIKSVSIYATQNPHEY